MRKLSSVLTAVCVLALASPLVLAWAPPSWLPGVLAPSFEAALQASFRSHLLRERAMVSKSRSVK